MIQVAEGCWIAARCVAYDQLLSDHELAVYANGESEQPSRLRYAHTSPIYVTVNGKGAAVRESIDEGQRMLNQFEVFARHECDKAHLESTLAAINSARQRLRFSSTIRGHSGCERPKASSSQRFTTFCPDL
jgi:hypothetical protein